VTTAIRKKDVRVGGRYRAEVNQRIVTIRITRESPYGGWDAVNESTGRDVRIRSATRLRGLVEQ
jgi:hypothetical protein